MTSPVVFDDAFARAKAAAAPLGLEVLDIFDQDREDHVSPWVYFEIASASADRLGLGEIVDEETGQVWLHLMVPRLSGSRDAIVTRKALSVAFRVPVSPLPEGLYYDGQGFDPPDADEKGNWFRFSMMVDYRYQDRVLTTP
ncbi:hypothetical protein [Gluconobacter sp. Gdi]|uniref:hypothetical protein n=1 Tax=Gluconobacter sp. Gdi TaxID=2691888 RepID=UPI00176BCAD7|nr:hypothetical protein [Gluconobacter sp. Gdi]GFE98056.1 hypothetical protein DmGdi_31290 [Gluconobacter sp. Gdi]